MEWLRRLAASYRQPALDLQRYDWQPLRGDRVVCPATGREVAYERCAGCPAYVGTRTLPGGAWGGLPPAVVCDPDRRRSPAGAAPASSPRR